ncbi:DinB family protein [Terrabacter aeriphilus]|uniref:DinB family protein n=1 Tax=Terrabacter aeriphilus TaxID=515662 RepID=A0ABP9JKR1_9MICO
MARFTPSDDLQGAEFVDVNLRGARFVGADLGDVVMRGVEVGGLEVDAPWLFDGDRPVTVNSVDVRPFVDAELDRRFPGRAERRAADPVALRHAWAALERAWAHVLERVATMPSGSVDVSVDGEWTFAQTLRHLVLATDLWLGQAVLGLEQPFHPLGLRDTPREGDASTPAPQAGSTVAFVDVLEARATRVALVRDVLATATSELLAEARANPHDDSFSETVLSCLHTILEEEWEHLRYAVRDLDAIDAGRGSSTT